MAWKSGAMGRSSRVSTSWALSMVWASTRTAPESNTWASSSRTRCTERAPTGSTAAASTSAAGGAGTCTAVGGWNGPPVLCMTAGTTWTRRVAMAPSSGRTAGPTLASGLTASSTERAWPPTARAALGRKSGSTGLASTSARPPPQRAPRGQRRYRHPGRRPGAHRGFHRETPCCRSSMRSSKVATPRPCFWAGLLLVGQPWRPTGEEFTLEGLRGMLSLSVFGLVVEAMSLKGALA
mmetsp:Transcript_15325/g.38924  ORF Transcript_15325/g.38924 Transcript_15325/m.38924 type:complete len:237 (-) Transcript_15325:21-731(-)